MGRMLQILFLAMTFGNVASLAKDFENPALLCLDIMLARKLVLYCENYKGADVGYIVLVRENVNGEDFHGTVCSKGFYGGSFVEEGAFTKRNGTDATGMELTSFEWKSPAGQHTKVLLKVFEESISKHEARSLPEGALRSEFQIDSERKGTRHKEFFEMGCHTTGTKNR